MALFRRARSAEPRTAIIDIGSNSVRLVVYQGPERLPAILFNEKVMAGLGRGLAATGAIDDRSLTEARSALARFAAVAREMEADVRTVATAAVRDASNGEVLLAAARALGLSPDILTGEEEARGAGFGVISAIPSADGIVGDLGGGSLELAEVAGAAARPGATFPLGGLMLRDLAGQSPKVARTIAREALSGSRHLAALEGRTFYAVGGTWRALAKLEMTERDYPVRVMHGYEFKSEGGFMRLVERTTPAAIKALSAVAEARRPLLAYGAIVLDEIVRSGRPARLLVSALGVREGLLYTDLDPATRAQDPLLVAAGDLNRMRARCPAHADDLVAWTDRFMAELRVEETADERRLRHAACLLSDVSWRAHPDYRGEQSLAVIAQASLLGIDHPGRAYLALAIFFRHEGLSREGVPARLAELATPRLLGLAQLLAAQFRLAYPISIAMSGILPRTPVAVDAGRIVLTLPPDLAALASERLANRMRSLGKLIDREGEVRVG